MAKHQLDNKADFHLRRAVERLREGLFDPVAVRLLTAHEDRLNRLVDQGFRDIDRGNASHLCICGAYGQGKSHSLNYIHSRALAANFAVSMINLDPREVAFHDFRQVYRALVAALQFPDGETSLVAKWRAWAADKPIEEVNGLLPKEMPHPFRAMLAGVAQKTVLLNDRQRQSKKHAAYRPREFPYLLAKSLVGDVVPIYRLQQALKYRQVDFYRQASLACKGNDPYLQMVQSLGQLFRQMGYRGWVLLFDEGESISQVRVTTRSRSYRLLDQLFFPNIPCALYPIFAFTGDFFQKVEDEVYDQVRVTDDVEIPYFDKDYAHAWQGLTRYVLQNLTHNEWKVLSEKLMHLHGQAYRWQPPETKTHQAMAERLSHMQGQETRYQLKALVDELDLIYQETVLVRL